MLRRSSSLLRLLKRPANCNWVSTSSVHCTASQRFADKPVTLNRGGAARARRPIISRRAGRDSHDSIAYEVASEMLETTLPEPRRTQLLIEGSRMS